MSHSNEYIFDTLRSHFLFSPLEERLQFYSWLLEVGLHRCMRDAGPAIDAETNESNTSDEQEWEVEGILASRLFRGKLQYHVRWKGCDSDGNWYLAHGFKAAPFKVQGFHDMHLDQPGPPKRLNEWIECWKSGQQLEDIPDDGLPRCKNLRKTSSLSHRSSNVLTTS
jgi:hypothetical protein